MRLVVYHVDQPLPCFGCFIYAVVEGMVVRGGNGQKDRIQLRVFKLLRQPVHLALPVQVLHARPQLGRHNQHLGLRLEQQLYFPQGNGTTTHYEHGAIFQAGKQG